MQSSSTPSEPEQFPGRIGRTHHDSVPWWPEPVATAEGSPNVIYVVLDDVGFADLRSYGSEIDTPNFDSIARDGLRYTNFHTTTLCSPTRASLLTGRNHHSVGMRMLSNLDTGFPSGRGYVTNAAATIAEILRDKGYNTMCVGKWHLAPTENTTASGPYDQWPLARGFERYYGFLEAETDSFYPELTYDNHSVEPPARPEDGYHLTSDLIDHAIQFVTDQTSVTPEKPFFMQLAFGSGHAPHQAPEEYLEKYRGLYDRGWNAIAQERHARQIQMGIIPDDTVPAPPNPGVLPWTDLSEDEKRLFSRLQEAYAAMIDHTDAEFGRFLRFLKDVGQFDNTLIVLLSDNGASQEGGVNGSLNTAALQNGIAEDLHKNLERIDDIGGPLVQPNYPIGWGQVSNTPFKRYKQNTHEGGVRDPLILHWPMGIRDRGALRQQFHHVVDITPTILSLLNLEAPRVYRGVPQIPLHGLDMSYTFSDADAPTTRRTQHFEMFGHRGIWHEGWKAVAFHQRGKPYDADQWELYDLDNDWSESNDLADTLPDKLEEMIQLFWTEAEKYDVLPLDDRGLSQRARIPRPGSPRLRSRFVYLPGMSHLPVAAAPPTMNRAHSITVEVDNGDAGAEGVLVALGGVSSGYVLYVKDGYLSYEYNFVGTRYRITSDSPIPPGRSTLQFVFEKTGDMTGTGHLSIDGTRQGSTDFPGVLPYFHGWHGLDIGKNLLSPVSPNYVGQFPYTGRIERVVFELADSEDALLLESVD
jgi:arylsulfatase A-like enzyme